MAPPPRWFVTARHRGRPTPGVDEPAPPYGVQHAREIGSAYALCGANVFGWLVFWHLSFAPDAPQTCGPCSEIVKQHLRGGPGRPVSP